MPTITSLTPARIPFVSHDKILASTSPKQPVKSLHIVSSGIFSSCVNDIISTRIYEMAAF